MRGGSLLADLLCLRQITAQLPPPSPQKPERLSGDTAQWRGSLSAQSEGKINQPTLHPCLPWWRFIGWVGSPGQSFVVQSLLGEGQYDTEGATGHLVQGLGGLDGENLAPHPNTQGSMALGQGFMC